MTNRILQDPGTVLASCQGALERLTRLSSADNDDRAGPHTHAKAQQLVNLLVVAARHKTIQVRLPHYPAFAAGFALLVVLNLAMRRIARRMDSERETGVEETAVYKSLSLAGDQTLAALDETEGGITSGFPRLPEMPQFSANRAVQALHYYSSRALPILELEKLLQVTAVDQRATAIDKELEIVSAAAARLCHSACLMADWLTQDNARQNARGGAQEDGQRNTRQLRNELAATIRALGCGEEAA